MSPVTISIAKSIWKLLKLTCASLVRFNLNSIQKNSSLNLLLIQNMSNNFTLQSNDYKWVWIRKLKVKNLIKKIISNYINFKNIN